MRKIYLCGITSKEYQNIKELTDPIYEHVDGLIYIVDNGAFEDGTFDLLNERKKEGVIIHRPFVKNHDYSMNHYLLDSGVLKPDDIIILRDSMERFNPRWAKELPNILNDFVNKGYQSFFYCGKGFAFVYNDCMAFNGNPHWGMEGRRGLSVDLSQYWSEESKTATWRIKDGEPGGRPFDNKINHEAKYAWTYGRSNHLLLGTEDEFEMYQRAEMIRQQIREFARLNEFSFDMDGLKRFMVWFQEVDSGNFKVWINSHRVWKNFYRYRILGEDFYEIDKNEKEWVLG